MSQASKKLGGRPPSDLWNTHIKKGKEVSKGHYEGICNYCPYSKHKGSPQDFEEHLANNCPNVPSDIRQTYLNKVLTRSKNSKEISIKKIYQTKMSDFNESSKLTIERTNEINKACIKAFVICGISWRTINNPFFIDFLKTLRPGYISPSYEVLSGRLFAQEVSAINVKIIQKLDYSNNLTLGAKLKEEAKKLNISGGGLKHYINTRWYTMYDCVNSIFNYKEALENLKYNSSDILSPAILSILRSYAFFDNIRILSYILYPVKKAIITLQSQFCSLADCFCELIHLGAAINKLNFNSNIFHNQYIAIFNKRYNEFDSAIYLLCFFLHPKYNEAYWERGALRNILLLANEIFSIMNKSDIARKELLYQMKFIEKTSDEVYEILVNENLDLDEDFIEITEDTINEEVEEDKIFDEEDNLLISNTINLNKFCSDLEELEFSMDEDYNDNEYYSETETINNQIQENIEWDPIAEIDKIVEDL
ncbi:20539_t:CDS:2 [Dentiscutata erythropus]|uniref:20539_t:CDS:1 n=1 Tax=Dentiscutata erythropus TaxID=1348616 RepID=A0A9N9NX29_9GLOM|nr:20539_t:CDS:2 [Dentiscutata erythropus]